MATLSKHGEYKVFKGTLNNYAYCSDGNVLRNQGFGWKLWKKLKKDVDWLESFNRAVKNLEEKEKNPVNKFRMDFSDLLVKLVPSLKNRQLVMTSIELMPDDPDGLFSTLDDYYETRNILSLDDCCKLCNSYKLAIS